MSSQIERWREDVANPRRRIPLGWPQLDELVRGPAPGEVFTVIARSFVGKSLIATNVMANNPDEPILFFSMEMPEAQVFQRLAAHVFDVAIRDIEQSEHERILPSFVDDLPDRLPQQAVVDDSGLSLHDMAAYVHDFETYYGTKPALVIVDYLETMDDDGGDATARVKKLARDLKSWSRTHRVGVLALHQTNRNFKNYLPPDEDSAMSGGYTEADVVLGLWRPGWDPELDISTRIERDTWMGVNVIKNRVRGMKHDGLEFRIDPAMKLVPLRRWLPEPAHYMDFYRDN